MEKVENKQLPNTKFKYYTLIPENGKCILFKPNNHKFLNITTHKALPVDVREDKLDLYEEVVLCH